MQRSSTVRALMLAATAALAAAVPASAVTTVTTVNGANWQIHDIAPPKLDTGSIRAISDNAFYGFGGIRVRVSGIPATTRAARLNGELMRGFGLAFDGEDAFKTDGADRARRRRHQPRHQALQARQLDALDRHLRQHDARARSRSTSPSAAARARTAAATRAVVQATSSGDALIGADDTWVQAANPAANGASSRGPHAAVLGTQSGSGNFQRDPFGTPLPADRAGGQLLRATRTRSRSPRARPSRCCATSSRAAPRPRPPRARRARVVKDGRDRAGRHTRPDGRDAEPRLHGDELRALRRRHLRREPRSPGPGRGRAQAPGHDLGLRRRRQVDHADGGRHALRPDHLAGDHARLPGPDRGLRRRPVRLPLLHHGRRRRHGPGQGRRRRPRRGQHERPARHPRDRQGPLRHQGHADHRRQPRPRGLAARSATPSRSRSCARPAR